MKRIVKTLWRIVCLEEEEEYMKLPVEEAKELTRKGYAKRHAKFLEDLEKVSEVIDKQIIDLAEEGYSRYHFNFDEYKRYYPSLSTWEVTDVKDLRDSYELRGYVIKKSYCQRYDVFYITWEEEF